jgi:hypothetical protein
MNNNAQDDPRDAHLLAALRHAPDRDATPPREVTRRILDAARAAVRPAPWWQRLSAWLMQPQVAASFGTLVVASLVGVMWSTREPPVAEFAPPPAIAGRLQQQRTEALPTAPQADAAKPDASAAASTSAVGNEARPQAAPASRPQQAAAKDTAARSRAVTKPAAEPAADAVALNSSAPPPPSPPPVAAAPAPRAADAAVPAAERRSANAGESRLLDLRREAASAPSAAGAVGLSLAAKAAAAIDPLARWDAALTPGAADSVRWRVGDRPPIAHGAAQALWWSALRSATAGTWQPQTRASLSPLPWLVLEVPAQSAAALDLTDDALIVCAADSAACWRAPITPAQREAWIAETARW